MELIGAQFDLAWEDHRANFARIESVLEGIDGGGGDSLIVLPELTAAGFTMNSTAVAQPRGGEVESFLADMAVRHRAHLLGGVAVEGASGVGGTGGNAQEEKPANEAVCYAPDGQEIARYRKRQPFTLVEEDKHYEAGVGPVVFSLGEWKVAPIICYDLRFPELFRDAAALGAELFVVIANWPSVRIDHWSTLLRARAIENLAYVIGVNRTGQDPFHPYPGKSIVVGPKGEVIAEAGAEPQALRATLDRTALLEWREQFPALSDFRDQIPF